MKQPFTGEEGEDETMLRLTSANLKMISTGCIVVILIMLPVLFLFTPRYYDWIRGDKIVSQHIREVVGNETDADKIALRLMNWVHENVHYPQPQENKTLFFYNDGSGIYKANNRTIFFLRNGPASWTILTKAGRCGEDARYFVEIMNKLGFKARIITPVPLTWDHEWAEYYNSAGYKIIVDPSNNKVITDKQSWVANKTIQSIQAIDLNGNKEDVTSEYLP